MAIEIIYGDGQTPINEEEKYGLKLPLSTQSELDQVEQANIEAALLWLVGRKLTAQKALDERFLKQLHKRMFGDVWSWAGKFRQIEKNIGVRWIMIGREVKVLCDDALYWINHDTYVPSEIALRFKHRLVSIHCFPNGNGRHSRVMADVLMANVFGQEEFSWQGEGLVEASAQRLAYIKALRAADQGDIGPLVDFAG